MHPRCRKISTKKIRTILLWTICRCIHNLKKNLFLRLLFYKVLTVNFYQVYNKTFEKIVWILFSTQLNNYKEWLRCKILFFATIFDKFFHSFDQLINIAFTVQVAAIFLKWKYSVPTSLINIIAAFSFTTFENKFCIKLKWASSYCCCS